MKGWTSNSRLQSSVKAPQPPVTLITLIVRRRPSSAKQAHLTLSVQTLPSTAPLPLRSAPLPSPTMVYWMISLVRKANALTLTVGICAQTRRT